MEARLLALSAALQARAMLAVAEEGLVMARSALILAVSHVLVELILALIAAGAVRVAVLAARNEVVALLDDNGRCRGRARVVVRFVILDGLRDETGARLGALDKLLGTPLLGDVRTPADGHDEIDIVLCLNILALSTASNKLSTLLALESITHINIAFHAPA